MEPGLDWITCEAFLSRIIVPFLFKKKTSEVLQGPYDDEKFGFSSEGWMLFNFGVGLGVILNMFASRSEIKKLGDLLKDTEDLVHDLKKELEFRNLCCSQRSPGAGLKGRKSLQETKTSTGVQSLKRQREKESVRGTDDLGNYTEDIFSEEHDSARSVVTEECVRCEDQMAELEAELKAELERMEFDMQSGESQKHGKKLSLHGELDAASVGDLLYGELNAIGLPEESTLEENEIHSGRVEIDVGNYAVPPLELERRLWKVLAGRQEERIMELVEALHLTEEKLLAKEKELNWWKDRVRLLTELSFGATSGEDSLSLTANEVNMRSSFEAGSVHLVNFSSDKGDLRSSLEGQETSPFTEGIGCFVTSEGLELKSCLQEIETSETSCVERLTNMGSMNTAKSMLFESEAINSSAGCSEMAQLCDKRSLQGQETNENPFNKERSQSRKSLRDSFLDMPDLCMVGGPDTGSNSLSDCSHSGNCSVSGDWVYRKDAGSLLLKPEPWSGTSYDFTVELMEGVDCRNGAVDAAGCHAVDVELRALGDRPNEYYGDTEQENDGTHRETSKGFHARANTPVKLSGTPCLPGTVLQAKPPVGNTRYSGVNLAVLEKIMHWEDNTFNSNISL